MNDAPIQIRRPEVARAIRALAEHKGQPITDVIAEVVNAELDRVRSERDVETRRRIARVEELVVQFAALPKAGPPLTDEDLYDEDGFPK